MGAAVAEDFSGGAGESVKNAGSVNDHLLMRTFLRGSAGRQAGMKPEIQAATWTGRSFGPMLTDTRRPGCQVLSPEGSEKAHKDRRADLAASWCSNWKAPVNVRQADQVTTT